MIITYIITGYRAVSVRGFHQQKWCFFTRKNAGWTNPEWVLTWSKHENPEDEAWKTAGFTNLKGDVTLIVVLFVWHMRPFHWQVMF